jgi:hypothetical protein
MQRQRNAFPSVTTTETTTTATRPQKPWRTGTGIAGKFRKGPPVARVRSASDLANFFGDDDKASAVAIRAALDNGLGDFVVSRAIASDTPANVGFRLVTAGTPQQSYVDATGDVATQGITLLTEYVSNVAKLTPSTSNISVRKEDLNSDRSGSAPFGSENFETHLEGQGTLNLRSELFLQGSSSAVDVGSLDHLQIYNPALPNGNKLLGSSNAGNLQQGDRVTLIAETNNDDAIENIHPGVSLTLDGDEFGSSSAFESEATVMSPAEEYFNELSGIEEVRYRFAIQITVGTGTIDISADWIDAASSEVSIKSPTEDKYVFSYSWDNLTTASFPKKDDSEGSYITGMFPSYNSDRVDGFVIFDTSTNTWNGVDIYNFFIYYDLSRPIQLSLQKPIRLVSFLFRPDSEISGGDAGFTPAQLKMMDESGETYDRSIRNSYIPSKFAVRIDQAMVYVGKSFLSGSNVEALSPGTPYKEVINQLFDQLNSKESSQDIFTDFSVEETYDVSQDRTLVDATFETRATGDGANNMVIKVALTGDKSLVDTSENPKDTENPPTDGSGDEVWGYPDDAVPGSDIGDDTIPEDWDTVDNDYVLVQTVNSENLTFDKAKKGPDRAETVLYSESGDPLVLVRAISPGKTDIEVSIINGRAGLFDLIVVDRDAEEYLDEPLVERLNLSNENALTTSNGIYPGSRPSKLVRAYYLPKFYQAGKKLQNDMASSYPIRSGPNLGTFLSQVNTINQASETPSVSTLAVGSDFVTDVKLTGGSEGSEGNEPSDSDYVEAVKRLESYDLVTISTPDYPFRGTTDNPVIAELIEQANRSDSFNGYRQAVLQLPKRLPLSRVKSIVPSSLNNERVRLLAGYVTYGRRPSLGFNNVEGIGFYLGWVNSRSPHISPAALSRSDAINGPTTTNIPSEKEYLDALTRNGIEGIYFDRSSQRLRFLNGQTTSTDIEGQYVSVVRVYDQIMMDLSQRLAFVRSQPLTDDLMRRVAGIVDTRLEYLKSQGWITGFRPTVADRRNNPPEDLDRGILNVQIDLDPAIPADHIILNFLRQRTRTLSLQTQV